MKIVARVVRYRFESDMTLDLLPLARDKLFSHIAPSPISMARAGKYVSSTKAVARLTPSDRKVLAEDCSYKMSVSTGYLEFRGNMDELTYGTTSSLYGIRLASDLSYAISSEYLFQ